MFLEGKAEFDKVESDDLKYRKVYVDGNCNETRYLVFGNFCFVLERV